MRHRFRWPLRALGRARSCEAHENVRQGYRAGGDAHRQRNLYLHQCHFQHRRIMSEKPEKDMVIYLSGEQQAAEPEALPSFDELTPREIGVVLDKYIVGENAAKKE